MKVHYETIEAALRRVITDAENRNRVIHKIELNPREWGEFMTVMLPLGGGQTCVLYKYLDVLIERGGWT